MPADDLSAARAREEAARRAIERIRRRCDAAFARAMKAQADESAARREHARAYHELEAAIAARREGENG